MTFLGVLVVLVAVGWLFVKLSESQATVDRLERRMLALENRLDRQSAKPPAFGLREDATEPVVPEPSATAVPAEPEPVAVPPPLPSPLATAAMPGAEAMSAAMSAATSEAMSAAAKPGVTPARPPSPALASAPAPIRVPLSGLKAGARRPAINWESFLGVKLFAWLGGFALFLGVAFFVKYSFEHNLISPFLRVTIGYAIGLGLLVGAWFLPRARQAVTVQSLTATGIVVLYADTFGAHALYGFLDFGFGLLPVFAIMSAITVLAFVLAVRLDAQVVAVLGWLGGFLTPWLLSTGQDNPAGLFGYLALLDVGLLAVAVRQRWNYLALLGAAATMVMQFGWVAKFFVAAKLMVGMTVFVGFAALFFGGFWWAHRRGQVNRWVVGAAMLAAVSGWLFAAYLLWHSDTSIAGRVWWLLGYILILDLVFVGMACWRVELRPLLPAAGAVVFLLLMHWTVRALTPERLNAALVFYLAFAALHAAIPFWLESRQPSPASAVSLARWMHVFPSLGLVLILVPLFTMGSPSLWVWPVVLFINVLAIALAIMTASLGSLLAVILLTALGAAAWIFQQPVNAPDLAGLLTIVGGFSVFFVGAGLLAARKLYGPNLASPSPGVGGAGRTVALTREQFGQMASLSASLPFLLLTMAVLRLPLPNPSAVFAVAAGLSVGLLLVATRSRFDGLMAVTLGGVLVLEYAWHADDFQAQNAGVALAWTAGFSALFFAWPLLGRKTLEARSWPWAVSALAWPLHFLLFYWAGLAAYPDAAYPGLIPALLAAPCAAALFWLVRSEPAAAAGALARRAWYAGAALFFVTLTIPIQFERHWITLGWALEGVALVALFHRVPHPGLRLTGVGLLTAAFVRLAMNPWVILEYERSGTPIWNWYLYTYGVTACALLAAACLLAPPRNEVLRHNMPPVLYSLGTILLFLLVNIEIADYFSPAGGRLVFNFSAGFAQDMAYTLAWALFASALMTVGFRARNAATRYAGLGLLVATMIKLFLHDLWRLGGLYRIGSLVGLAVVLILVSFVYQRFLAAGGSGSGAGAETGKPANPSPP